MTGPRECRPCHPLKRRLVGHRLGRRSIFWLRLGLIVPMVLVLGLVVIAKTGLAGAVLIPTLEEELGVEIEARSVSISRSGVLVLDDVRMRAPGVSGPGGELLRVQRIAADVDWSSAMRGASAVRSVTLVSPNVRLSQDSDSGRMNFEAFQFPDSGGMDGPVSLPTLNIEQGSIEFCEHTATNLHVLKRINVDGSLRPEGEDAYTIDLAQRGSGTVGGGIGLTGTIDKLGVEFELSGVSLDEWGPDSVPGRFRQFVELLNVQGEISNTTFSWSPGSDISAAIHLNGVGITLPIAMNSQTDAAHMRLSDVSGAVSLRGEEFIADISGLLEDVPYRVSLTYGGLTADAPFEATFKVNSYHLAENPDFVPYLPEEVGHRLRQFAGAAPIGDESLEGTVSPTAVIDASVRLWRAPPGADGPADVRFQGDLEFTDGSAAYAIFPYPFRDMTGSIQFDNDRIRIIEISGRSETGAKISATGLIAPIGPTAGVELSIDTVDVPIDDTLESALGSARGEVVSRLFNDERYAQLVDLGLVLAPGEASELVRRRDGLLDSIEAETEPARVRALRAELEQVRDRLRRPVFAYRGVADLAIRLRREIGTESHWTRRIEVRLPHAGLLLEDFPYPISASDVVVVLSEREAELVRGSFRPVGGGSALLTGSAALRSPEGEQAFRPAIRVRAEALPLDDLLRFAIAPPLLEGKDPVIARSRQSAVDVLDRLGLDGRFDADGLVLTRRNGAIGFDIAMDPAGMMLAPETYSDRPPMLLGDLAGELRLTEHGLSINAQGLAMGVDDQQTLDHPVDVRIGADLDWSEQGGTLKYAAHAEADGVPLGLPVEQVIASLSHAAGKSVVWLRDTFHPAGKVDVRADMASDGVTPTASVTVTNLREIVGDYLGGRLGLSDAEGSVTVTIDAVRTLHASGITGMAWFDGDPVGRVAISGDLGLDPSGGDPNRQMDIRLEGGRFDSSLAERVMTELAPAAVTKEYLEHGARGEFDAVVSMLPPRPGAEDVAPSGLAAISFVETSVWPKWAAMTRLGTDVRLDGMSGRIVVSRAGARLERLRGESGSLTMMLDGATTPDGLGGAVSKYSVDLDAPRLNLQLRAVLPVPLLEVIDRAEGVVAGPIHIDGGELRTRTVAGVDGARVAFDGVVGFEGASGVAGVRVEGASGEMQIRFEKSPAGLPEYAMSVVADEARVVGLALRRAQVVVESSGLPRGLVVPMIAAECCEGVISGHAVIAPADSWAGPDERTYANTLTFSGMKLSKLLDGFASRQGTSVSKPRIDTGARVEGEISLAGLVGHDETRRGRVDVQIAGGTVLDLPGAMMLVEMGNLQPPVSERIDYANIQGVFDGGLISIEGLSLISQSVELLGYGTVSWPELGLDLRFRSKATRRIPVLSQLLESIRDEFVSIRVTGSASKPQVRVESLPETRRVLGHAFGTEESARARRMNDLAERARRRLHIRRGSPWGTSPTRRPKGDRAGTERVRTAPPTAKKESE